MDTKLPTLRTLVVKTNRVTFRSSVSEKQLVSGVESVAEMLTAAAAAACRVNKLQLYLELLLLA